MKKTNLWFYLFLAFTYSITSVIAIDRLAVDEKSAKSRTTIQEAKSISVPKDIQEAAFKSPEIGLKGLVNFLTGDTNDEFVKVKRIHDWITENIAYDSDLLLGLSDQGSRKVTDLLPLKRTTCGGFSGLFQKMADLAGIKAETITGNSKTCWIKKSARDCHHVWNSVFLENNWYYVDTTADSRFTYKFGAFTPKKTYKDTFLFIKTEAKLLINLPLEERQQYKETPMTRKQFLAIPRVTVAYHKYAIEYTPETISQFREEKKDFEGGYLQKIHDAVDSKDEVFTLKFKAPENISFFPKIVTNPEEAFDDAVDADKNLPKSDSDDSPSDLNVRAFCFRDNSNLVICQYSVPKTGRYKAYLQAREAGDLHKFSLVHAFTLNMEKVGPVLPQITNQIFTNPLFNFQEFKLLQSDLNSDSNFRSIEVQKPEDGFITSFVFDSAGKQIPSAVEFSYLSRTNLKFYYQFPSTGVYWVKLQTRIPNITGADRQNVALARVEVKTLPQNSFPSINEVIFTKAFVEEKFSYLESNLKLNTEEPFIKVKGLLDKNLECSLYDLKKKAIANTCKVISEGEIYTFQFAIPSTGLYGARIIQKDGNSKKILGYFKMER